MPRHARDSNPGPLSCKQSVFTIRLHSVCVYVCGCVWGGGCSEELGRLMEDWLASGDCCGKLKKQEDELVEAVEYTHTLRSVIVNTLGSQPRGPGFESRAR